MRKVMVSSCLCGGHGLQGGAEPPDYGTRFLAM
jgi:hypothetical protein